jgi:hypothetical protein
VFFGARLVLGFDSLRVSGVLVPRRGRAALQPIELPLPPGSLVPSVLDDNLIRPEEVAAALRELHDKLGADGSSACLVLPDAVARLSLVEAPLGVAPLEFARFRLAQGLPFPGAEAVVDGLPVGGGRCVAAAVRRRVVRGYEEAAAAAGFRQERVDLASLAALEAVFGRAERSLDGVVVVLGDTAYSLAVRSGGSVVAFRSRRRDPAQGEAQRLREEIDRSAALCGFPETPRVLVAGTGAARLIGSLRGAGRDAAPAWSDAEVPVEGAWLGAALS